MWLFYCLQQALCLNQANDRFDSNIPPPSPLRPSCSFSKTASTTHSATSNNAPSLNHLPHSSPSSCPLRLPYNDPPPSKATTHHQAIKPTPIFPPTISTTTNHRRASTRRRVLAPQEQLLTVVSHHPSPTPTTCLPPIHRDLSQPNWLRKLHFLLNKRFFLFILSFFC